jgi:putative transcriptional regulator
MAAETEIASTPDRWPAANGVLVFFDIYAKTTRRTSVVPKSSKRRSRLGERLTAAAREAAAHTRGEIKLNEYEIHVPPELEVAAIRARLELSQAAFAKSFGLDLGVVQAWEQKRRRPDRCARILLAVIAKEPDAVRRALAA